MRPPCDELERLANERLRDARDLIAGGVTFERACEITGCDPDDPVSVAHLPGSTHPAPSPEQIAARAAEIRRGWSFATERARYTLGPERRKTFPGVAAMSGVREVAMSPVEN